MAKKKRRSRSRSKGTKSTVRSVPKTVGGVVKNMPLAMKGGIAISVLEMLGDASYGNVPLSTRIANTLKGTDTLANVVNASKSALVNPKNYKPVAVGYVVHWVNKKTTHIKGL